MRGLRTMPGALVAVGWGLCWTEPALASCAPPPSIEAFVRSGHGLSSYYDTVFIGDSVTIRNDGAPSFMTTARFRVVAVLRGRAEPISFVIGQAGVEDGFTFHPGHRYVVVAHTI